MEHTDMKVSKKRIYSTVDGKNYVEMLKPEDWSIIIEPDLDNYGGYTYPYTFSIALRSPDKTASISYFSPRNYIDDRTKTFTTNQIDDYGNLLHHFETIDQYLHKWAVSDIGKYQDFSLSDTINTAFKTEYLESKREKARQTVTEEGCTLTKYYFNKQARLYSYVYNNYQRVRLYAGIIEAEDVYQEAPIPMPDNVLHDTFMTDLAQYVYPDARYVRGQNRYYRRTLDEIRWSARQLLTLGCLAKDYDFLYQNVLIPIMNEGITICDDIWKDYDKLRAEKKIIWQQKRDAKKQASWASQKAAEERRQANAQFYNNLRKTQQEIHDIQRSAYENTQRSQAKVREMWGDVNQGNTRFVDRHGNEHVLHTYDNYAYKSGDTYVSSDSPLDMPYDFEELKKKKY